jgi:hypothetical protein
MPALDESASVDDAEVVIGRVLCVRILEEDGGMRDLVLTDDGNGEELDLPTAVGMLTIGTYVMLTSDTDYG